MGQAEAGGGWMQKVAVYGEDEKAAAEGVVEHEGDGNGFVGAER